MALNKWVKTKSAIKKLEELLKCNVCGYLLKDPCSINSCDHTFCRVCATKAVDSNSKCPECGSFAWLKDLQVNRQLAHIVEFCTNLQHVISKESKDQGSNLVENRNNTLKDVEPDKFLFDSEENKDRCDNILTDTDIGNDGQRVDMIDAGDCHADESVFSAAETKSMICVQKEQIHTGSNAAEIKSNIIESINVGDTGRGRKEEHRDAGATICKLLDDSDEKHEKNEPKRQKMKENHEKDANTPNQADPPSWPLSSKKPKKSLRTYSNLKHNKIARKPILNSLRKDHTSSDSDFEHPAGKKDKEAKSGKYNEALTTHISDQSNDLFVFDEDKVQEIENDFFHPQKQDGEDEIDLGSNVRANSKRQRPVTRLRRNKVTAEKNDTSAAKALKRKGSKRKSSLTDAGNKNPNKRKSDESCAMKRNKKGETPLHLAAIKGNYDVTKELLKNNADPNAKDFAGWTPLHEACNHGRFEIVQLLLDNGALIDIPGCDHDTPLHDAIANDRLEVAEFLITKGASLEVRNKQGMLPMDYIRSSAAKEQILMAASIAQENRETRMANTTSHVTRVTSIKPKRILCTGLTTAEMKSLEKCAKMLTAKIVNQFDEQVTHIVSAVNENKLCSRTMKYLLGLLTGKWIVSSLWVEECLKLKTWVNEDDFEVKGCPDADEYTPRKSRLNATKQFPGLFDGCSFYFSGEFKPAPPKAELLELIRLGGGLILHREPKVETAHPLITPASPAVMKMMSSKSVELPSVAYHAKPNTAQSHCTQYILFDEDISPDHKRISTPIMCTAPTRWLMDCVSKFEILEVKDI